LRSFCLHDEIWRYDILDQVVKGIEVLQSYLARGEVGDRGLDQTTIPLRGNYDYVTLLQDVTQEVLHYQPPPLSELLEEL
jgi:hypothetical protein